MYRKIYKVKINISVRKAKRHEKGIRVWSKDKILTVEPYCQLHILQVTSYNYVQFCINALNAELNLICHLLELLRDLTFMGPCIVSIFQYIYNKMQRYTVYLYLETALYVSGGTFTHHQERIQLYLQHLLFVTPLLLSAAIVEELEPVPTFPR
jgi:hypothetical protein